MRIRETLPLALAILLPCRPENWTVLQADEPDLRCLAQGSRTNSVAVAFSSAVKVSLSARSDIRCDGSRLSLATSQRTRLRHSEL